MKVYYSGYPLIKKNINSNPLQKCNSKYLILNVVVYYLSFKYTKLPLKQNLFWGLPLMQRPTASVF